MGASQLSIYNGALRWLQERKLASLTEKREPRRYMDDEYAQNILDCLAEGNWNFAMNRVRLDASKTEVPNFGLAYAFPKPDDWNHTFQVSDNEAYDPLLREYTDMNGYWFADISPIYVDYISSDANYGLNLAMWTPLFTKFVEARLAWLCAGRITGKQSMVEATQKIMERAKARAINKDSQDLPPGKPPYGTWVTSRAPRGSITPIAFPYGGTSN